MNKTKWKYLVDTLLFLCMVGIALIGILMGFFLPTGPKVPESSKYLLGLHRHQWGNIHLYLSLAFIALVIIHLILEWNWIKSQSRKIFRKNWATVLILTAVASLLVIFLFWLFYPKSPGAYEDHGIRAGRGVQAKALEEPESEEHEEKLTRGKLAEDTSGILVTGRMTLSEIETQTGIPARMIVQKLGLPQDVPRDETLGRLRKRYSFTMQEVRDVVASLLKKE